MRRQRGVAFAAGEPIRQVLPGKGVSARVDGRIVTIGAPARLGVSDAVSWIASRLEGEGKSVSVAALAGQGSSA